PRRRRRHRNHHLLQMIRWRVSVPETLHLGSTQQSQVTQSLVSASQHFSFFKKPWPSSTRSLNRSPNPFPPSPNPATATSGYSPSRSAPATTPLPRKSEPSSSASPPIGPTATSAPRSTAP